jgi:hypothetical protein
VLVSGNLRNASISTDDYAIASIFRDSTNLGDSVKGMAVATVRVPSGTGYLDVPCSMVTVDTPGDTSAHTYAVKIHADAGGNTITWVTNSSTSNIILVEVGQ